MKGESLDKLPIIPKSPYPNFVTTESQYCLDHLSDRRAFPGDNAVEAYLKEAFEDIVKKEGNNLLSGFGGDQCITYNQFPVFLTNAFWSGKCSLFGKMERLMVGKGCYG